MSIFTKYLSSSNFPGSYTFTVQALFNFLTEFACWFIKFGIIALGVMMIVYALMFFKSRGNPQGMGKAKEALTWGIVGGLVITGVFTIILSVAAILGSLAEKGVSYPILKMFERCV